MTDIEFGEENIRRVWRFLDYKPVRIYTDVPTYHGRYANSEDELVEIAREWNGNGPVWVAGNPADKDADINSMGSKDISEWSVIFHDVDATGGHDKDNPATKNEVKKTLEKAKEIFEWYVQKYGIERYLIIMTGNGAALWVKVPPHSITKDNFEAIKQQTKTFGNLIITKFGDKSAKIDHVADLRRIMRLPGTMNVKGAATTSRPHKLAKIMKEGKGKASDKVQKDILSFETAPPITVEEAFDSDLDQDTIDQINSHPKIARLIDEGRAENKPEHRYKVDFKLAMALLKMSIPVPYIAHIIMTHPNAKAPTHPTPQTYVLEYVITCAKQALINEGGGPEGNMEDFLTIVSLGDDYVQIGPVNTTLHTVYMKGEKEDIIFPSPIRVQKHCVSAIPGGDFIDRWELEGIAGLHDFSALMRRLKGKGWINHPRATYILGAILSASKVKTEVVEPVIGVVIRGEDDLCLTRNGMPIEPEEKVINEQVTKRNRKDTKLDLLPYMKIMRYYTKQEAWTILGWSISSPFQYPLKQDKDMRDFFMEGVLVGPPGIGKSSLLEALVCLFWGIKSRKSADLESKFRPGAIGSAIGLPTALHECATYSFDKWSDETKNYSESDEIIIRGTIDRDMVRYWTKSPRFHDGNGVQMSDINVRPRILVVRARADKKKEREKNKKEFEEAFRSLPTIGLKFLQWMYNRLGTEHRLTTLKKRITIIQDAITKAEVDTLDQRRLYSWALHLWGFLEFETWLNEECQQTMFNEHVTDKVSYLIETLIRPLEKANKEEDTMAPVQLFTIWHEGWKVNNPFRVTMDKDEYHTTHPKGKGETWDEDDEYYYFKGAHILNFRRDFRDIPIRSENDLRQEAASFFGGEKKDYDVTHKFNKLNKAGKKYSEHSVRIPKTSQESIE